MHFQKLLYALLLMCVLSVFGKSTEKQTALSESEIKKELERFNTIKDKVVAKDTNIIVEFSASKVSEEGNLIKRHSFELRPLVEPKPSGSRDSKSFDENTVKLIFDLAKKYNVSAAASRERFDNTGVLTSKTVYADYVKIHYEDGDSEIKIREHYDDGDVDTDESVDDLIALVKEFDLPLEAEKKLFDKTGALIKSEKKIYTPKKVKIISVEGMPVDMQMKVAEALKRSCVMKETGTDRIKLLVRYLGIQFPEYSFEAAVGDGFHYFESDVTIKVEFDGDVYNVWGTGTAQEEEEEE